MMGSPVHPRLRPMSEMTQDEINQLHAEAAENSNQKVVQFQSTKTEEKEHVKGTE